MIDSAIKAATPLPCALASSRQRLGEGETGEEEEEEEEEEGGGGRGGGRGGGGGGWVAAFFVCYCHYRQHRHHYSPSSSSHHHHHHYYCYYYYYYSLDIQGVFEGSITPRIGTTVGIRCNSLMNKLLLFKTPFALIFVG